MAAAGHCLCGAVRYEVDADIALTFSCHCQYCRRAHGAAFVPLAMVATRDLHFIAGEDAIVEYETSGVGRRGFCGRCGTRLYNKDADFAEALTLVAGTLDEELREPPALHLNLESAAPWYEICDGRPQFDTLPPGALAARDALVEGGSEETG